MASGPEENLDGLQQQTADTEFRCTVAQKRKAKKKSPQRVVYYIKTFYHHQAIGPQVHVWMNALPRMSLNVYRTVSACINNSSEP